MCEREALGFLYRYLEFVAGEDRVKLEIVLAAKVCIGIAKSHYSVETPLPLDNRRIEALGSIGGGDRDHPIFGGDAVEAVKQGLKTYASFPRALALGGKGPVEILEDHQRRCVPGGLLEQRDQLAAAQPLMGMSLFFTKPSLVV